jgi:hypothetical protein
VSPCLFSPGHREALKGARFTFYGQFNDVMASFMSMCS